MSNFTPRPWVMTALRAVVGLLALTIAGFIILFFVGLNTRVERLESQPIQVITTVVTPSPTPVITASPSATVAPVRVRPVVTAVPTVSQ